jgi:Methyltransferase domain
VWFTDEELADVAARYRGSFKTAPLSYATVRDFCDSFEHLRPVATANGDPNSQRPWVLKAILAVVPPGSRVLEIGAGEPFIADILDRLGYEVWVVNPYDGTRDGSLEYERFRDEWPGVHFVRSRFGEHVLSAPQGGFDCIYSISVLDRLPDKVVEGVFAGMRKYLQPNRWSIHAIDHVCNGEHYEKLKWIVLCSGIDEIELTQQLERMEADHETYYLSIESHNRSHGSLSSGKFPERVCVSMQVVSRAVQSRVPTGKAE